MPSILFIFYEIFASLFFVSLLDLFKYKCKEWSVSKIGKIVAHVRISHGRLRRARANNAIILALEHTRAGAPDGRGCYLFKVYFLP